MKLRKFLQSFAGLDKSEFLARFGHPFLVRHDLEHPALKTGDSTDVVPPTGSDEGGPVYEPVSDLRRDVYALAGERLIVGRGFQAGVRLQHPAVSVYHAELLAPRTPDGPWRLVDPGSTNGTWVDGDPVRPGELRSLDDGTTIQFAAVPCAFLAPESMHVLLQRLSVLSEAEPASPQEDTRNLRGTWRSEVGDLDEHPLPVLLESLQTERASGVLEISGSALGGRITFRAGRPLQAHTTTGLVGVSALRRLIMVGDGTYRLAREEVPDHPELGVSFSEALDMVASSGPAGPLQESELRLQAILQSVRDGIVSLDPELRIESFSPGAERLLGCSAEEVLGRRLDGLLASPLAARAEGWAGRYEVEGLRKGGERFPLELTIGGGASEAHGYTAVLRDLSSRRQMEEALERSEERLRQSQKMEAVGRLAGGVAHDFNNLLTAIQGYTALLRQKAPDEPDLVRYLDEVSRAASRGAALTRRLLAFSRQRVTVERENLDLGELVDVMHEMLRRLLGEQIELRYYPPRRKVSVLGDRNLLEQVVVNLAVNAREAMPVGGSLSLTVGEAEIEPGDERDLAPGLYARLVVSDTGTGMSEEIASRAFEPFFTTKQGGTGLGLATVYGIVQQTGGHIELDSKPGRGTTFDLYLPRPPRESDTQPVEPTSAPESSPDEVPSGPQTVLLVEDEASLLDLATELLEDQGYQVLRAPDGQAALELAQTHGGPLDLLLSDMVMPRLGGAELAQRLRGLRPEIPVLLMSGYVEHVTDLPPDYGFLPKPFTPAELLGRVREALNPDFSETSS